MIEELGTEQLITRGKESYAHGEYAAALADSGHAADARAVAEPLIPIVAEAFAENSEVKRQVARWN